MVMSGLDVSARGAGPAWEHQSIRKRPHSYARANLQNYDELLRTFSWADARALLDGLPGGGLNIAPEVGRPRALVSRADLLRALVQSLHKTSAMSKRAEDFLARMTELEGESWLHRTRP